jgi:hypothetical protein
MRDRAMSYRLISQLLYENYYAADCDIKTSVTSSYWDAHGQNVTVKNQDGNLQHNNPGFISAQRSTIVPELLNLPIRILLHGLLKKYEARGSTIDRAKLAVNAQKVLFEFNHAKQVLIYDLISSFGLFSAPRTICIIGDGYGYLGSLIKLANPETKLIFVNLGRNLLIDLLGFQKVHPESSPVLASSKKDIQSAPANTTVFLEAEKFELLSDSTISLFINIASMQEMDHNIIERYFQYMRSSRDQQWTPVVGQ